MLMREPVTCPVMIIMYHSQQCQLGPWPSITGLSCSHSPHYIEKDLWEAAWDISTQSVRNNSYLLCFWLSLSLSLFTYLFIYWVMRTDLPSGCERLLNCLLQVLTQSHPVHLFPAQEPRSSGAGPAHLHPSSSSLLLLSKLSLKNLIQVYPLPPHLTLYHSDFLLYLFSLFPKISLQTALSWLPWAWDTEGAPPPGP